MSDGIFIKHDYAEYKMLKIPYVSQEQVVTRLGQMTYYQPILPGGSAPIESPETLVFLHGFGGGSSAFEWSKVFPAFASDYRVIAPDLVGWGQSVHLERDYKLEDYLSSIPEFVELTCSEPVTAIASSLTAAYLIRIATAQPQLFQRLILVAPAGLSDFGEDYSRTPFAQIVSTPILDRLLYGGAIASRLGIYGFLQNRQFADASRISDDIVDAYLASAQQPHAEYTALSFVRGDLCFDLADYIESLTTPTAILWGEKSQFTSPEIGRRLASKNPEAIKAFEVIHGTGLTPQLELPAVTTGLIRQFLSTL